MKSIKILVILSILFFSCEYQNNVSFMALTDAYTDYILSDEYKDLFKADSLLHENKEFMNKGLTDQNSAIAIPILMQMQKFEELETLLINDITLNKYYRDLGLNLARAYIDSIDYKTHINASLDIVNDSIANGTDSLIYMDYFFLKMHLQGKELTLLAIDSIVAEGKIVSDGFCASLFKDKISDFPEDQVLLNYHQN